MKYIPVILALYFFLMHVCYAQSDFSFSGYIVELPVYSIYSSGAGQIISGSSDQFTNLIKLRIRPEIYLWKYGRINMEYEADVIYSNINNTEFLNPESSNRQILNLKWNLYNKGGTEIIHYIDRLYFRQGFTNGNIIAGRQRIAWGVGRVWSPTDLFNPLNPANFGKTEKDGADALSFTYSFGNFTDLNLVYNPQEKINGSNYGLRLRTNVSGYDLAAVGGYFDHRLVMGGDFAGNILNAGLRGEGIISADNNDFRNNYVRLVFGLDNQFTSSLYAMMEYQYNGEGSPVKDNYNLAGLLTGKIINLSRNYIFVSSSYIVNPLLTVTVSDNTNLNDQSGFFLLTGAYSLSNNSTVTLGGLISYGSNFSEYRYYPTSLYIQGELFF